MRCSARYQWAGSLGSRPMVVITWTRLPDVHVGTTMIDISSEIVLLPPNALSLTRKPHHPSSAAHVLADRSRVRAYLLPSGPQMSSVGPVVQCP